MCILTSKLSWRALLESSPIPKSPTESRPEVGHLTWHFISSLSEYCLILSCAVSQQNPNLFSWGVGLKYRPEGGYSCYFSLSVDKFRLSTSIRHRLFTCTSFLIYSLIILLFFLNLTSVHTLIVGAEVYRCTWWNSVTNTLSRTPLDSRRDL
jgi:hypothetical protein